MKFHIIFTRRVFCTENVFFPTPTTILPLPSPHVLFSFPFHSLALIFTAFSCFNFISFRFHSRRRRRYRMKTMIHCISTELEMGNASKMSKPFTRTKQNMAESEDRHTDRKKNQNTNAVDTCTVGNEVEKKWALVRDQQWKTQKERERRHSHRQMPTKEEKKFTSLKMRSNTTHK